ncbi:MAG TPA: sugar phosphate nucleotidyltransferase, partial [Anaeromyxobacteraceae bacterium]|nr:sugar phosphate nucleotidyltransferase [Anaeromyxobacteraceae bacterium]
GPLRAPRDLEGDVKIFPVIMAGGSGTRFWPLSRRLKPKQFLPLAGDVPLPALMAPGVHRTERRLFYGLEVDVHYYEVEGRTIWGATARVLSELLEIWSTL